jgi:hypothetical protein
MCEWLKQAVLKTIKSAIFNDLQVLKRQDLAVFLASVQRLCNGFYATSVLQKLSERLKQGMDYKQVH